MLNSIHDFLDDEYSRIRHDQNNRIPCPHCASLQGHYLVCPLINGRIAEAHSLRSAASVSKADDLILHALGVKW